MTIQCQFRWNRERPKICFDIFYLFISVSNLCQTFMHRHIESSAVRLLTPLLLPLLYLPKRVPFECGPQSIITVNQTTQYFRSASLASSSSSSWPLLVQYTRAACQILFTPFHSKRQNRVPLSYFSLNPFENPGRKQMDSRACVCVCMFVWMGGCCTRFPCCIIAIQPIDLTLESKIALKNIPFARVALCITDFSRFSDSIQNIDKFCSALRVSFDETVRYYIYSNTATKMQIGCTQTFQLNGVCAGRVCVYWRHR